MLWCDKNTVGAKRNSSGKWYKETWKEEWKRVIWFHILVRRCVFPVPFLWPHHPQHATKWNHSGCNLLAAHRVPAELCVSVILTASKKETLSRSTERAASFPSGGGGGTTASALFLSFPPLLPSRPSFRTPQPCKQSLFIPPSSACLLSPLHSPPSFTFSWD